MRLKFVRPTWLGYAILLALGLWAARAATADACAFTDLPAGVQRATCVGDNCATSLPNSCCYYGAWQGCQSLNVCNANPSCIGTLLGTCQNPSCFNGVGQYNGQTCLFGNIMIKVDSCTFNGTKQDCGGGQSKCIIITYIDRTKANAPTSTICSCSPTSARCTTGQPPSPCPAQ